MTAILNGLWSRVVLSYKSTLVGLGFGLLILVIEAGTDYLNGLPAGWAKGLAALLVMVGASLRSKALPPSEPPAP
jgi:hypothetical protein